MDVEPHPSASPESSPSSSPTATRHGSIAPDLGVSSGTDVKASLASASVPAPSAADKELDKLTSNLSSLSLVPPSIRFGRGGKAGGFRGRGGHHGSGPSSKGSNAKSTEGEEGPSPTKALGDGKRPARGKPVAFGATNRQLQQDVQSAAKEVEMAES